MNIILKATEYNWGLKGPGDWESITWKVYESGACNISVDYVLSDTKKLSTTIPNENFPRLKELIYSEWEEKERDACDGAAWIITAYDGRKVVNTTGIRPRYTYGLKTLEEIESLLPKKTQS